MKDIIVKKRQIFNRYTSKSSHICIIWSPVGQFDKLYRKVVHLLTANVENSGLNACAVCILLHKWALI